MPWFAGGALAAIGLLLVALSVPPAGAVDTTGAAGDAADLAALRTGLATVFGAVDVTSTPGGPAHLGREPSEWANFAGTKAGDTAVLYRTDQLVCPADPTYLAPCSDSTTWRWDPQARSWSELPGANQPQGRLAASSAAVGAEGSGQVWLYSGQDHQGQTPYDARAWLLGDDGVWSEAPCDPACAVGAIDGSAGAAGNGSSLLFGGLFAGVPPMPPFYVDGYSNTVFRWTGSDWEALPVSGTAPEPRAAAGFAFDGVDFILFGGGWSGMPSARFPHGFGDFHDTWRLHQAPDGSWSWSLVCSDCGPAGRHQMSLTGLSRAGDLRHGAILVGGQGFNADGIYAPGGAPEDEWVLSDVWAWNGATWTQIAPIGDPCDVDTTQAQPCWSDPSVRFAPFGAAMPAAGAAAVTFGSCNGTETVSASSVRQLCTRATVQVQLVDPPVTTTSSSLTIAPQTNPPSTVAAVLPATGATRETPWLTGLGLVLAAGGAALCLTARRRMTRDA